MNGIISRTLAALAVGSSLAVTVAGCVTSGSSLCGSSCSTGACGSGGCGDGVGGVQGCYRKVVDPCYPERYWAIARQNTESVLAAQIGNGRVLQQTVWNYHFEPGTDKLTPGGIEHLVTISRRRPTADPRLFLQTAQDVTYDAERADKYPGERADLDAKRVAAVRNFLQTYTAARPVAFEVAVHDPGDIRMGAVGTATSVVKQYANYQGVLPPSSSGSGGSSGGGR